MTRIGWLGVCANECSHVAFGKDPQSTTTVLSQEN